MLMKSVIVSMPVREKDLSSHYNNSQSTVCHGAYAFNPLPTNLCNLLSHKGAALKLFDTKAKKAFFTF